MFEHIAELSKNARTIHTVYVSFLIYCALTALTTPDRKIILDEQAQLPLINLDVPFSGFVSIAPLIAIFIFVYFQLHIQVIKRKIHELYLNHEAVGRGRLYPWLLNMAEEPEGGVFGKLQRATASASLWLLPLVVLFLLTAFTTQKRDLNFSLYVWLVSLAGSGLVILFWCRYDAIPGNVRPAPKKVSGLGALLPELECPLDMRKLSAGVLIFSLYTYLAFVISYADAARPGWLLVDLSHQVLIKEQKPEYNVYWASLRGVHLEGARLEGSVLIRADLRGAYLRGADLQLANLSHADLTGADLSDANLLQARLNNAVLSGANLSGAVLNCADLSGADLSGAKLKAAFLINVKNLQAEGPGDRLCEAASLFGAVPGDRQGVAERCPHLLEPPALEEEIRRNRYPGVQMYQPPDNSNQSIFDDRAGEVSLAESTHIVYHDPGASKVSQVRFMHVRKRGSDTPYLRKHYVVRDLPVACKSSIEQRAQ